jgi:ribosomal protein S12 methylthiotransferase
MPRSWETPFEKAETSRPSSEPLQNGSRKRRGRSICGRAPCVEGHGRQTAEKISLISLGCPKNQVDSEILSASFLESGFSFVPDPAQADVIVLNTCSFIEEAVQESLEILEKLARYRREGSCRCIVLAGCLVQRYGRDLRHSLPEVDLFLGTEAIEGAGRILASHLRGEARQSFFTRSPFRRPKGASPLYEGRQALGAWAYVKIAEGCSNACSYCTLPLIRGPLKSRPQEEIICEVEHLARQGIQEINLVAQDVTAYGRDWDANRSGSLGRLLERLERIQGIEWIRLLYCHPAHLEDDTIARIRDIDKICPYLDLPIQHVSRPILRSMGRPYDEGRLRSLIERLRKARPGMALRTTVMVGFPGETDRDVEKLLAFLGEVRFHHLGVFCYSPEKGTTAKSREETVPNAVKEERRGRIMALQAEISRRILEGFVGTRQQVLIEGTHEEDPACAKARTRCQAPEVDGCVILRKGARAATGLAWARIVAARTYDLEAKLAPDALPGRKAVRKTCRIKRNTRSTSHSDGKGKKTSRKHQKDLTKAEKRLY